MSNPFTKTTSDTTRINAFTSDHRSMREHSIAQYHKKRDAELQAKRDQEALEKQRAYEDALDMANYPTLLTTSTTATPHHQLTTSYADQIKKEQAVLTQKAVDPDVASLLPGWTLLRKHPVNGLQIYKYMEESKSHNDDDEDDHMTRTNMVFEALANLHESRTNGYIDQFGYEEWEETFKYPRWREDQIYLEETEAAAYTSSSDTEREDDDHDFDDDAY